MKVGTINNTDPAGVIGLRGGTDTRFSGGGQTLDILMWGYQHEDATGRSDTTTPSEYVATTTAAAIQHQSDSPSIDLTVDQSSYTSIPACIESICHIEYIYCTCPKGTEIQYDYALTWLTSYTTAE